MEFVGPRFGINPAANDNYAIKWATRNGHSHVVEYLIDKVDPAYGIDPSAENNRAFQWAAYLGHLNIVKYYMG